ncbi:hypothetical protein ACKAVU_16265 [Acinetobacter baumannii]
MSVSIQIHPGSLIRVHENGHITIEGEVTIKAEKIKVLSSAADNSQCNDDRKE